MSRMKISDRRSLANIARELGHPVKQVAEMEVRPEDGPPGRAEVTVSLRARATEAPGAPGEPADPV